MSDGPRPGPPPVAHPAGLCGVCRNAREIENRRGSRFWLCRLSAERAGFPKYPPLPVARCGGFEDVRVGGDGAAGGGGATGS